MILIFLFIAYLGDVDTRGYFPIYICGGTSIPPPSPLPGIKCDPPALSEDKPVFNITLRCITGGTALQPLDIYKCHRVVTTASCYTWWTWVKEIHHSSHSEKIPRSVCLDMIDEHSRGTTFDRIEKAHEDCSYLRTRNTAKINDLFEITTAFFNILANTIHLPGQQTGWPINNTLFSYRDDYYWVPPAAIERTDVLQRALTHSITCDVLTDRIVCPDAAVMFYYSDTKPVVYHGRSLVNVATGFHIVPDKNWLSVVDYFTRTQRRPRSILHNLYNIELLTSLEKRVKNTADRRDCEFAYLKRMTALAVSLISPTIAAEIEFSRFYPGVSLTHAGVIKHSCQEIVSWRLREDTGPYSQIPISYTMFFGAEEHNGWLDPTTRTIVSSLTKGIRTRYIRVNFTHVFDLVREMWLEPVEYELLHKIITHEHHGIMSYLQDELEGVTTLTNSLSLLDKEIPNRRVVQPPTGFTVYGQQPSQVSDSVTKSNSWFSAFLPNWLSNLFDIGGSLISTLIVCVILIKIIPPLISFCLSMRIPSQSQQHSSSNTEMLSLQHTQLRQPRPLTYYA